jgi:hypothetical protein
MKNAELLGSIYAILVKLADKSLTIEQAMQLIRELIQ